MVLQDAIRERVRAVLIRQMMKAASDQSMRAYAVHWADLPTSQRFTALKEHGADPDFHKAVQRNRKIPAPLRRQVDLVFKQRTRKPKAVVQATARAAGGKDGRKRYAVGYDAARRRWTCTCLDWLYRRSWLPDSRSAADKNCKHIKAHLKKG